MTVLHGYDAWKLAGPPEGPDMDLLYDQWVEECYHDRLLKEVVEGIEPDLFYRSGSSSAMEYAASEANKAFRDGLAGIFQDRRTGAVDKYLLVEVAAELDAARGPARSDGRSTPTFEKWLSERAEADR